MNENAKHTPTPWIIVKDEEKSTNHYISGRDSSPEVSTTINIGCVKTAANAAYIVRACNCHEALVEACQALLAMLDDPVVCPDEVGDFEPVLMARAALAQAEGKESENETETLDA